MSVASEQASIALTVDVSGSMSADDVKPTRLGAAQEAIRRFLDQAARQVPRRPRHVLVRAVRRLAAHARPRARARGAPVRHRRSAGAPRSATRSRARSSCSSPSAPTATAPARPRRRRRPPASRTRRCRRSCCSPTAPRRAARSQPLEGAERAQVVRHPGLHGRARHPERRHRPTAASSRPVPPDPDHAAADRAGDGRRVLRDRRTRRASTPSTRTSPPGSARSRNGAS